MDAPKNSPCQDLTKFEVSKTLEKMLERIKENDCIDTPGIRMAMVRAKQEGEDELRNVLEFQLLPLSIEEGKRRREVEQKEQYEIDQNEKEREEQLERDRIEKEQLERDRIEKKHLKLIEDLRISKEDYKNDELVSDIFNQIGVKISKME